MKKRGIWITTIIVMLLAVGGGYLAYKRYYCDVQAQEPSESTMETVEVTRGDIVITADGSGELIPARELELSFRTSGVLDEVLVETGDRVEEGDVLARLETDALERALAETDTDLQIAELELADVRKGATEAELANAEARVRDAQTQVALAYDTYREACDSGSDDAVETAKTMYDWWVSYYQSQKAKYETGKIDKTEHDYAMAAMIKAEEKWERAKNQAKMGEVQSLESLNRAQNDLVQAREDLELLQSEPLSDTLMTAELKVDEAAANRKEAELNLQGARLTAPFDGTVMDVAAGEGDRVGSAATVLTLADLEEPLLRFWLEESDWSNVAQGYQVNVTFEALPDHTFTGTVLRVGPVLVTVSGTSAVRAQAKLSLGDQDVDLLSGMTADVEVISAEARDAVLVPVEALRETEDGDHVVFVVTADGKVERRAVEVGLEDAVNAEILSGLDVGEMVRIQG